MKTFVLILAMLTAQLAAQDKQTQKTEPPQITVQPESAQTSQTEAPPAVQQPQIVVKPTAKPAQPPPSQQLITFNAEQLDEYENRILDRAENFYNNRMTHLLWTMSIIMTVGLAIVGILIPMLLEWQRKRSFAKELATHLSQSEDALKKYAEEQTEKLRIDLLSINNDLKKAMYSNLSVAFLGLGGLLSKELSPEGYALMLKLHVLAMKFSIIGQRGTSLTASQIIQLFTETDKGSEIALGTLKAVDEAIENMKGDVENINNDQRRLDMESQVRELQIFVHSLIQRKQQKTDTTPPQAG